METRLHFSPIIMALIKENNANSKTCTLIYCYMRARVQTDMTLPERKPKTSREKLKCALHIKESLLRK